MRSLTFCAVLLASTAVAAPAPTPNVAPEPTPAPDRNVPEEARDLKGILPSILQNVEKGVISDLNQLSQAGSAYVTLLKDNVPTATPTPLSDVPSHCSQVIGTAMPSDIVDSALSFIANVFKPGDLSNNVIGGYIGGINAQSPNNPSPNTKTFPKKKAQDAPFLLSEKELRSAIYIPSEFKYGRTDIQPIILIPGTGAFGGVNFASNMVPLLRSSGIADPVWLNIPGAMLDDAQSNAEHIAYAINHISTLTSKNVAIMGWSQGNLAAQWALKYWPSIREKVSDFIDISPDYHGTVNAYALCPGFPKTPCCPSIRQQDYGSAFVTTLRSGGGDSAYVPTTNVFSSFFDEIVQPQSVISVSGILNDARKVGVTNNEVQHICPGQPGGAFHTHEGVLFNSVAWALAKDALTHKGPGKVDRLDLDQVCADFAVPGLSLEDALATEGLIPLALANIFFHPVKTFNEVPLRSYTK